jgi:hypothetical protein
MRLREHIERCRYGTAVIALIATALLAGSCTDDDGESSRAGDEVRGQLQEGQRAQQSGDAEIYLAHVTENWLATVTEATAEEIRADPSTFQRDESLVLGDIVVSGNSAQVRVDAGPQGNLDYNLMVEAIKEDEQWKFDRIYVGSADTIPADAKLVDVEMDEWAILFDPERMTSDTKMVIRARNTGTQPHLLVLVRVPQDGHVRQLLELEPSPNPTRFTPGLEELGAAAYFGVGDPAANVVIMEKLPRGRYAFLCFATDPEDGLQHVAKGMIAEFTLR